MLFLISIILIPTYWSMVLARLLIGDYGEYGETKYELIKDIIPFRLVWRYVKIEFNKL